MQRQAAFVVLVFSALGIGDQQFVNDLFVGALKVGEVNGEPTVLIMRLATFQIGIGMDENGSDAYRLPSCTREGNEGFR